MPVPARAAPAVIFRRPPSERRCISAAHLPALFLTMRRMGAKNSISGASNTYCAAPAIRHGGSISGFAARTGSPHCFSVRGVYRCRMDSFRRVPHGADVTPPEPEPCLQGWFQARRVSYRCTVRQHLAHPAQGGGCGESRVAPLLFGAGQSVPPLAPVRRTTPALRQARLAAKNEKSLAGFRRGFSSLTACRTR